MTNRLAHRPARGDAGARQNPVDFAAETSQPNHRSRQSGGLLADDFVSRLERLPAGARWGLAAALVALCAGVSELAWPLVGGRLPFLFYFPGVAGSAWLLGVAPGFGAAIVSALLAIFLPHPDGGLPPSDPRIWLGGLFFLLVCTFLVMTVEVSRRARARAESSSRRHREILEGIRAGFAVLGRDWTILYANPEAERILAVRREDIVGKRLRDVLPIQDSSFAHLKRAMEERVAVEYDSRDPVRGVFFSTRAFPTDEGIGVFFLDVTEKRKAEEEANAARERLDLAHKAARLGWWSWEIESGKVEWSDNFEEIRGLPPGSFGGEGLPGFLDVVHPEDRAAVRAAIDRAVSEAGPYEIEFRVANPGGGIQWIAGRGHVTVQDGHPVRLTGISMNITERKRTEEDRERARELFLGTLGHDLGTPLSTILASAQVLEKRMDEASQKPLARIKSSAVRMGRMIDQLLDFTRARLGSGIPVKPQPCNLRAICEGVLEEFEAQYPRRVHFQAEGDLSGDWDADRLEQVISNLVVNAIHHGTEGEPVNVRLTAVNGTVRLEVTNRGSIDRAAVPALYEPFRRAERSRSIHPRGLGLGLFITREIVRSHGGSLDVLPREGATTFAVTLPGAPRPI